MSAKIRTGILLAAFSLLVLSACVSTSFRPARTFEARSLPPVSPTAVRVLASPPNEAFRFLGEIEANISGFPSEETIIRKLRERAADVGADAIIFNPADNLFGKLVGNVGESSRPKLVSVRFTAIRLLPGDASQRQP